MDCEQKLNATVHVPFPTNRLAQIAFDVLRVDAEPKRSGVKKELILLENILQVTFSAEQARQLRVAVNSFFDNITLITETIDFAGSPVSDTYDHF